MKTSFSDEEVRAYRPRLLYARWLYEKGARESDGKGELDDLVAITLFHAAIEAVVQNILLAQNFGSIKQMRSWSFVNMVDVIDKKGGDAAVPPLVPLRSEILSLVEARNDILHHGRRYHRSEVDRARSTCRRFLVDAAREFFCEDIDSISAVALVEDAFKRDILRAAETARTSSKLVDAIALARYAVELALDEARERLWRDSEHHEQRLQLFVHSMKRDGKLPGRMDDAFEELCAFMKSMRNREHWLVLAMIGIEPSAALRFYSQPVNVNSVFAKHGGQLKVSRYKHGEVSELDAEFALNFAVDACIKAASTREQIRRVPRQTVIADWEDLVLQLPAKAKSAQGG